MKRSARTALAVAAAGPIVLGAVSGLFYRQSQRLRRALAVDSERLVPVLHELHSAHGPARPITDDDGDTPALALLGDTWLAGNEAVRPGRLIASGLSRMFESPVRLSDQASPSARAEDVAAQVADLLRHHGMRRSKTGPSAPRYAVVSMGMNDVIHPVTGSLSLPVLTSAISRLQREGGYRIIVLTCPDLGGLPQVKRPLQGVLRRSSRVLSGSQWVTTAAAGGLPVSIHQSLAGTTRVGLLSHSGLAPSTLGFQQIAATVLSRIAHDRGLVVVSTPPQSCEGEE
ncbi:SGNH/GDSL hydrolase family protein [Brevibacterium sp. 50QC2O2]|uniref:SGNH/GDSL hydrolase family protein n=1 Tax=Brevibacterium TaxID=1696 RepID=UPI00211BEF82|nr:MULTISPECIES: SGNH/GDSL hydrolase family protein [unclassified Brevibacterium]MCQ9385912.1 SGNH/GDSL hydrolase family protein [Brevibacterium sp. 68QC2CO]MCQ9387422.1 SGNH/GDSL hydrolase family protein [Brevibacterium sp. 50QC2O2]